MRLLDKNSDLVNKILPHKNEWAWNLFIKAMNNTWLPTQISMAKDIEQWKAKDILSDDERLVIKRCLGFFAGSESLVSNNLLLNIFNYIQDAECRQYIIRQALEEGNHNWTIVYICDSLNLDVDEVYEAYKNIPSIKAKDDFLMKAITDGKTNQDILTNLITYYILCEGIFFFSGFALLLSFGRQHKIPGIAEQIQYTLIDESLHIEFGTKLINQIVREYPELWTEQYKAYIIDLIDKTCELEIAYAKDILPRGILGLNANMFIEYMNFIKNRRLRDLNLTNETVHVNPFPWLSEIIELEKCKNFFETHVNSYALGNLVEDF